MEKERKDYNKLLWRNIEIEGGRIYWRYGNWKGNGRKKNWRKVEKFLKLRKEKYKDNINRRKNDRKKGENGGGNKGNRERRRGLWGRGFKIECERLIERKKELRKKIRE